MFMSPAATRFDGVVLKRTLTQGNQYMHPRSNKSHSLCIGSAVNL